MFAVLRHYGIPEPLVNAIGVLYNNSESAVMVDGNISEPFEVSTGVLQDDFLAPFLFIILVDYLLKKTTSDLDSGAVTHPRRSRRYPVIVLNDLDFADDIALLESTIPWAQAQLTSTVCSSERSWPHNQCTHDRIHDCKLSPPPNTSSESINHVTDFRYLGSKMVSAASDFKRRKALAWSAYWKLKR